MRSNSEVFFARRVVLERRASVRRVISPCKALSPAVLTPAAVVAAVVLVLVVVGGGFHSFPWPRLALA